MDILDTEMTADELIDAIMQVYRQESEDRAYMLYCTVYPKFTQKTYVPFEEFFKPVKPVEEKKKEKSNKEKAADIIKSTAMMFGGTIRAGDKKK